MPNVCSKSALKQPWPKEAAAQSSQQVEKPGLSQTGPAQQCTSALGRAHKDTGPGHEGGVCWAGSKHIRGTNTSSPAHDDDIPASSGSYFCRIVLFGSHQAPTTQKFHQQQHLVPSHTQLYRPGTHSLQMSSNHLDWVAIRFMAETDQLCSDYSFCRQSQPPAAACFMCVF